uniref:Chitin synthase n=1 Tax=Globodera rostochiensis TaxID=31243 RepID=A0A914HAR9_GLORO
MSCKSEKISDFEFPAHHSLEDDVSNKSCGENMVYSLTMNDSRVIHGKKFNCSFVWLLERYQLSDKYAINETIKARRIVKSPGDAKFVFVTAADDEFYPSLRMLVVSIKEKFGCNQRIIAYDMGIVTKNKEWVK